VGLEVVAIAVLAAAGGPAIAIVIARAARPAATFGPGSGVRFAALAMMTVGAVLAAGHAAGLAGAGMAALAIDGALAVHYVRRRLGQRELQAMCTALATTNDDAAFARVEARLAKLRAANEMHQGGYEACARWTLHAAAHASHAGRPAEGLRWAEAIDPAQVGPTVRAMRAQHVAAFAIGVGDRPRARAVLAGVRRPVSDTTVEGSLAAIEALLDALDGDTEAARAKAERALIRKWHPSVRLIWNAALAHARVAAGAPGEARALLIALRAEHGDFALRRVAGHQGPASALAAALLAGEAPYR
jgi:hypothetical protein